MFNDLKGKRILITGSTAGMGLAAARIFAIYGAKIGINSRAFSPKVDEVLTELTALGGDVAFFPADLTDTLECERLVKTFTEHFGGMDVLINNAGGLGGRANLESIDDEFYERVMDLNVRSALMTTKFSIPHLRASAAESGKHRVLSARVRLRLVKVAVWVLASMQLQKRGYTTFTVTG
ncbi:hypothetical protein VCHA49P381_50128 [Vibrio chagasii]|nr:hypothetical protein VCHA49P381_50128 [Vibrio chagasii]